MDPNQGNILETPSRAKNAKHKYVHIYIYTAVRKPRTLRVQAYCHEMKGFVKVTASCSCNKDGPLAPLEESPGCYPHTRPANGLPIMQGLSCIAGLLDSDEARWLYLRRSFLSMKEFGMMTIYDDSGSLEKNLS